MFFEKSASLLPTAPIETGVNNVIGKPNQRSVLAKAMVKLFLIGTIAMICFNLGNRQILTFSLGKPLVKSSEVTVVVNQVRYLLSLFPPPFTFFNTFMAY